MPSRSRPMVALPGRAGLETRVLVTDVTREFEHQSGGDGRGGIAEARRAANDDTLRFGSFEIDRGIAHAGGDQKFEIGQGFDHGPRKGGALAHGADNGIVFERRYDLVRGAKVFIERLDLDVACDTSTNQSSSARRSDNRQELRSEAA